MKLSAVFVFIALGAWAQDPSILLTEMRESLSRVENCRLEISKNRYNTNAFLDMAKFHYIASEYDDAREYADKVSGLDSRNGMALLISGYCSYLKGENKNIIEDLYGSVSKGRTLGFWSNLIYFKLSLDLLDFTNAYRFGLACKDFYSEGSNALHAPYRIYREFYTQWVRLLRVYDKSSELGRVLGEMQTGPYGDAYVDLIRLNSLATNKQYPEFQNAVDGLKRYAMELCPLTGGFEERKFTDSGVETFSFLLKSKDGTYCDDIVRGKVANGSLQCQMYEGRLRQLRYESLPVLDVELTGSIKVLEFEDLKILRQHYGETILNHLLFATFSSDKMKVIVGLDQNEYGYRPAIVFVNKIPK